MVQVDDLKQCKIFALFSDSQLSEMAGITEKKSYKKYMRVHERGEQATHLFVVSKGLVSLRDIKSGDLVGISFEICEPGELFGTASLMKPREHTLTAVCLEDSEVVALEAESLLELCKNDPRLGYNLMLTIAELYFDRYKHAKKQLYEIIRAPTIITALPG